MPDVGHYFDVMATHPYVYYGRSPEAVWLDDDGRVSKGAFSAYREVRATMQAHGDTKPIWFTEFGWSTATQNFLFDQGVSQATQADYLSRAYSCLEQDPYVKVATWYALRDPSWESGADAWSAQLGLMAGSTRKPAYYALRDYVPGAGGCNYQDPFAPADPGPAPDPAPQAGPTDPGQLGPTPEPEPQAADGSGGEAEAEADHEPGDAVTSSSVRSPAMLTVTRAQLRRGRLILTGSVATGATGRLRGRAHFGRGLRRFTAQIDSAGSFRIDQRLRRGRRATSVRVTLVYRGSRYLLGQTLTLTVRRPSALRPPARPS
jgi:hypothetical protein